MQLGDIWETRIDNIAFGGAGVARVGGMVVFVPYTATKDEVEIEIIEMKKRFAIGRIKRILVPSELRIKPVCLYYGVCGGCHIQHINYRHQLEIKERQVRELFERLGKFTSLPISDIIPSPYEFNYRCKADYHVSYKSGKVSKMGFIHASKSDVVDIKRCEIVEESINSSCEVFRQKTSQSRLARIERQTIWASSDGECPLEAWDGAVPFVTRYVKGRRFLVPYDGFFQINSSLVPTLVEQVIELSALKGDERVVDCYCGAGLFTSFLADQAGSVEGIEINGDSLNCAQENVTNAGIANTVFYSGDVCEIMDQRFVKGKRTADVVILDPPRGGCEKGVLDSLKKLRVKKIIYISCNPSTQVRDIRYLADAGFRIKCVKPLDMFPQTGHIEVIALLET